MNIVFELPFYSSASGGVMRTVELAHTMGAHTRFQRMTGERPPYKDFSVGLPDHTFPPCDIAITYSDTSYMQKLRGLPQVSRIMVYMLSWGMTIDRERANAKTPGVTVLCSSKKIEDAIRSEGIEVHRIGHSLPMYDMYIDGTIKRQNYLAILYHPAVKKRYDLSIRIANSLFQNKVIDGVISFGMRDGNNKFPKPVGLVKHYPGANRDQIRELFNQCRYFLMPSVTEGVNLTPIESCLCGCIPIIVDGAIEEIFEHEKNCFIVPKDSPVDIISTIRAIKDHYEGMYLKFALNMRLKIFDFTVESVAKNLMKVIEDGV